jgi:hypothetical protein
MLSTILLSVTGSYFFLLSTDLKAKKQCLGFLLTHYFTTSALIINLDYIKAFSQFRLSSDGDDKMMMDRETQESSMMRRAMSSLQNMDSAFRYMPVTGLLLLALSSDKHSSVTLMTLTLSQYFSVISQEVLPRSFVKIKAMTSIVGNVAFYGAVFWTLKTEF